MFGDGLSPRENESQLTRSVNSGILGGITLACVLGTILFIGNDYYTNYKSKHQENEQIIKPSNPLPPKVPFRYYPVVL
jgi:hypothetical protein